MTWERWLYADVSLRENSVFHHLGGTISQTVPRISSHKSVITLNMAWTILWTIIWTILKHSPNIYLEELKETAKTEVGIGAL
jgi:hypothetical protein